MKTPFPTTKEYPVIDILKVQNILYEMLRVVKSILDSHNIDYFVAFGTLMGLKKYHDFLPWDDDIDLFLFDEDYHQTMKILASELPHNLIVHGEHNDSMYFKSWNTVKNLNVQVKTANVYHSDNKKLGFPNLGLDLYKLKKVNAGNYENIRVQEFERFFRRKVATGMLDETDFLSELERAKGTFAEHSNDILESNSVYYFFPVKMKRLLRSEDIFPLRKDKFRNLNVKVPANIESVLKSSFSDIDALPVYTERRPHLNSVVFINE